MPLNEFLRRLLGLKGASPACSHLARSARFRAAYQAWTAAQEYLRWTSALFEAYHFRKTDLPGKLRVQLVEEEYRHGFVFFFEPGIGGRNFHFLFELLKDRVLQQGYRLHSANTLGVRHERYTERAEKYVLVPPASDVPGTDLCNQLYGNILLDYIQVNGRPGYIRMIANSYPDPYFSKPLPFPVLLEQVLRPHEV